MVSISLAGSTALQLTPVQSITELVNSDISDLVHSKGYFKGSSHSLDHVLSKVINREIALCALGGLIGHLDRLMVCFRACYDAFLESFILKEFEVKVCL